MRHVAGLLEGRRKGSRIESGGALGNEPTYGVD